MIKKLLDKFFLKKTEISEKDIEEYLTGKDLMEPENDKKRKIIGMLFVCLVVIVGFLYLTQNKKLTQNKSIKPVSFIAQAHKPKKKPKKINKKQINNNNQINIKKETNIVENKKSEKEKKTEKILENIKPQEIDVVKNEEILKNPFSISDLSATLEEMTTKTKLLEKEIELYKKQAELLEAKRKVKKLEKASAKENKNLDEKSNLDQEEKRPIISEQEIIDRVLAKLSSMKQINQKTKKANKEEKNPLLALVGADNQNNQNQELLLQPAVFSKELINAKLEKIFSTTSFIDMNKGCIYLKEYKGFDHICIGDNIPKEWILSNSELMLEKFSVDDNELNISFVSDQGGRYSVSIQL